MCLMSLVDNDASKYDVSAIVRNIIMTSDINQASMFYPIIHRKEITLIDCNGMGIRHLMKFFSSMGDVNIFLNLVQDAIFYKIEKIHVFNVSPIISKIYSLLKPFIKKELQEQIFFHTNHEDLYGIIDREELPNDYGGFIGTVEELHESFLNRVADNAISLKEFEIFLTK